MTQVFLIIVISLSGILAVIVMIKKNNLVPLIMSHH